MGLRVGRLCLPVRACAAVARGSCRASAHACAGALFVRAISYAVHGPHVETRELCQFLNVAARHNGGNVKAAFNQDYYPIDKAFNSQKSSLSCLYLACVLGP